MKGNAQFFDDCVFLSITLQWLKDILNQDFFYPNFKPLTFQPQYSTLEFSIENFSTIWLRWLSTLAFKVYFWGQKLILWEIIPYERHYNPRFVYFLPTFWSSFMYCELWPYLWLVFKSGFQSKADYSGWWTVNNFLIGVEKSRVENLGVEKSMIKSLGLKIRDWNLGLKTPGLENQG